MSSESNGRSAGKTTTAKQQPSAPKRTQTRTPPPTARGKDISLDAALSAGRTILEVPLALIQPDPNQPRKVLPTDDFADIAGAIEVVDGAAAPGRGIREPITIRKTPPHLNQEIPWTIVKGERRYRAADRKGLNTIPSIIVEIDEADVLGEQLLENLARSDLSPLETSDALVRLQREQREGKRKLSAEDLAFRCGLRSARMVHRYLALARLAPEVRAELAEGKIGLGLALELATLEEHKDQVEALGDVRGQELRWAKGTIRSNYHLRLIPSSCGFNPADASLPGGACEACPKNSKAQRELWADEDNAESRCTDRKCFEERRATTAKRKIDAAAAAGAKVLTGDAAKAILPQAWSDPRDKGFVDLDEHCDIEEPEQGQPGKTWREVLGKQATPSAVLQDDRGQVRQLLPTREAAALAKAAGKGDVAKDLEEEATALEERQAREAGVELPERRDGWKLEREAQEAAQEEATARILDVVRAREGLAFWRFYAAIRLREEQDFGDVELLEELARSRGIEVPKDDDDWSPTEALLEWLKREDLTEADCRALVVEIVIARQLYHPNQSPDKQPFLLACRFAGLDFEQLLRQHREARAVRPQQEKLADKPQGTPSSAPKANRCRVCGCTDTTPCHDALGTPCSWANLEETFCTACSVMCEAILERVQDAGAEGLTRNVLLNQLDEASDDELDDQRAGAAIQDLVDRRELVEKDGRLWSPDNAPLEGVDALEQKVLTVCRGKERTRQQITAACKDDDHVAVGNAIMKLVQSGELVSAGTVKRTTYRTAKAIEGAS